MKNQGQKLVVEPAWPTPPERVLNGHLLEVTGVAVTKDVNRPLIVSASEDGTVRLWDMATGREQAVLRHPAPVRAVACTPPGAEANLCLAGMADGSGWLWDLNGAATAEPRKLSERHRGPVNTVAFSPDGKRCATGGEDGTICLWETASGRLQYRLTAAHRGRVTSVQLPTATRLVSAGGDNCLLVWTRGEADTFREVARFDRRSGTVPYPGVSADGERVLLDVGKELQVVSLLEGTNQGIFRNLPGSDAGTLPRPDTGKGTAEVILPDPPRPGAFTTVALFSPDSRMALTVSDPGGRLQLWRAPTNTTRPYEVRQLVWKGAAATCGTFAPNGSFVVTGMKDRRILVWSVPTPEELTSQLEAEITLVEPLVDPKSRRVRVWAEMDNPHGRLIPGATATLVSYPR
jgi:WD40 repeat protein